LQVAQSICHIFSEAHKLTVIVQHVTINEYSMNDFVSRNTQ
jgi:hypothetical protein